MKKSMQTLIARLFLFSFLLVWGASAQEKGLPRITVHDELEFLKALGSDRVITVAEGASINLSKVLEYQDLQENAGLDNEQSAADEAKIMSGLKYTNHTFDGEELMLYNMNNLTIVGEGEKRPSIVVEPRYAYIFNFVNCARITIRHLQIGHTEEGECMGGVLRFEDCRQVKIDDCDLYGCGTEGITALRTQNVRCVRSTVRDCSYSIMTLEQCNRINFMDCAFTRNREYSLVNVDKGCMEIYFSRCEFTENKGLLFALQARVHLTNCRVQHPEESVGDRDKIIEKDCTWSFHTEAAPEPQPQAHVQPVFFYQWTGKLNGEKARLVCAQQDVVLLGEIMRGENEETRIDRVVGHIDADGITLHVLNPTDVCQTDEVIHAVMGPTFLECFDERTQQVSKLRQSDEKYRYRVDREPNAFCSPFMQENIYYFKADNRELAGIYCLRQKDADGNYTFSRNMEIMRHADRMEQLEFHLESARGLRSAVFDGEGTLQKNFSFLHHLEYGECDYTFQVKFFNDFLLIRRWEGNSEGCFDANMDIVGIYMRVPAVG